ncbi:MAG: DUF2975 domain-containing protein [Bacilli bacterium]|jgi:hypothetical protein
MNTKRISIFLKLTVLVFGLIGLFMVGFFFPYETGLIKLDGSPVQMNALAWAETIVYWICSLPCFVVIYYAYLVSNRLNMESFFSDKTVHEVEKAGIFLISASSVFLVSNIVFTILKGVGYELFYSFLGLVGMTISALLLVGASLLKEATAARNENESFI